MKIYRTLAASIFTISIHAQSPQLASAQSSAHDASAPAFDVASIKRSKPGEQPNSNFPLGPGDVYVANGGYFSASNQPLLLYIAFAYKINGNQLQLLRRQLPDWVSTDQFDIQARASRDPGKEGMRMMMRALLADRFKFAFHTETRDVPVLAMTLVKPGATGKQLWPHPDDARWSEEDRTALRGFCRGILPAPSNSGDLAPTCAGVFPMRASQRGRLRFVGRNATIGLLGDTFSAGIGFDRPLVDQTGLKGTYDFTIEFTPERRGAPPPDSVSDDSVLLFQDALREQLGIKLESKKAPLEVMTVDHIQRPAEN